jgi:hypothetical protein
MPKRLIIALLFVGLVPALPAQMRGGSRSGGFHNGNGFSGNRGGRFGRGLSYWGDPYFYADYPVQSLAYEAPPLVVQAATPPAPERPSESVMIEWQGDHYVRDVSQHGSIALQDYSQAPASGNRPAFSLAKQSSQAELPPAVLVYRDGHREQVLDYVIARGSLYARGNYWQDGYWSKNIQLAALDIPATMKANQDSGVKFVLPSSPNEVVTRP